MTAATTLKTISVLMVEDSPMDGRLLLEAIIHSQAARDLTLPQLEELGATRGFQSSRVFEILFALYRNQPAFDFPELETRLEDSDKTLMASILFADEVFEEKDRETKLVVQAQACLNELQAAAYRAYVTDLKTKIREAERGGDVGEALRLMQVLGDVEKGRSG